jgi:hypothetical protein
MKLTTLIIIQLFVFAGKLFAQYTENPVPGIPWEKVVLKNHATFNHYSNLEWGSGFLIQYKDEVIACTAREFTGTMSSSDDMLYIEDFDRELKKWIMYLPDDLSQYVELDSLVFRKRIEKKFSIFMYSESFLTFSVKQNNTGIIPLEPDVRKIQNGDTLYVIGYADQNLKIVRGVVQTTFNEKYSMPEIRLRTDVYVNAADFIGAPIVEKSGKVVGLMNRAYWLTIDSKGRVINPDKEVDGTHVEYFVQGTTMRTVLGKDYHK